MLLMSFSTLQIKKLNPTTPKVLKQNLTKSTRKEPRVGILKAVLGEKKPNSNKTDGNLYISYIALKYRIM